MSEIEEPLWLPGCTVLGGSGYALSVGTKVTVGFGHSFFTLHILQTDGRTEETSYPEVVSIAITGPGRVTTGGGFLGGGFGVTGALEGMALAGVLNALTTHSEVHTILEIITDRGELFLHYGEMEPGALRIALSPVFTRLRELDPIWLADREQRLAALRDRGVLNAEQFERLTHQLTTPTKAITESPLGTSPLGISRYAKDKLARGLCPKCDAYCAFNSETRRGFITCEVCGGQYPSGYEDLPTSSA